MKKILPLLFLIGFASKLNAQISGCPDHVANNYNSLATVNDGSCTYNDITLTPTLKFNFNTVLNESSGLLNWKSLIWSHNDSGNGPDIYGMNSTTGTIQRSVFISNATNVDWEDIAQDNSFIYVGDFGNNANGNRTDLKIYRIAKKDVTAKDTVTATVIRFSYSDQTDFTPKGANNTNFDCEAMIAYGDSLFLFSKDWVDNKTRLYKLPKKPGTYTATNIGELNVAGLITGAEILSTQRVIVLSGYNGLLSPFIYLLYDFGGNNFFGANKRKVQVNAAFTQMEGICSKSATNFFVSNEKYSKFGINVPAKVNSLNLASLLNPYYNSLPALKKQIAISKTNSNAFVVVQNLQNKLFITKSNEFVKDGIVNIYDINGVLKLRAYFTNTSTLVNVSALTRGFYVANVSNKEQQVSVKFLKE
jgi:hypothetical protein